MNDDVDQLIAGYAALCDCVEQLAKNTELRIKELETRALEAELKLVEHELVLLRAGHSRQLASEGTQASFWVH